MKSSAVADWTLRSRIGSKLQVAARVLLAMAIVAAPWMYGSTRHWAIVRLSQMLLAMGVCWACGCLLRWRSAIRQGGVVYPALFLFFSGWLVSVSGPVLPADPFTEKHFAELSARWPGSFIVKTPLETMFLFSGLLFALMVTIELSTDRRWRMLLFRLLATVGVSIVAVGIVQVGTEAKGVLWDATISYPGYFFATFFQHTVAGAFVNLIWPLSAGMFAFRCSVSRQAEDRGTFKTVAWGFMTLLSLCGLAVQVSRFAVINAGILAVLFGCWITWRLRLHALRRVLPRAAALALFFLLVVCGVAVKGGKWQTLVERWRPSIVNKIGSERAAVNGRSREKASHAMREDGFMESSDELIRNHFLGYQRLASGVCLRMIPQAGLLGFGPGSWTGSYPHFTDDPFLRTFFLGIQFANEDYLQTVVEWGLLGALAWAMCALGGLWRGVKRLARYRSNGNDICEDEGVIAGSLFSLTGIFIHALIDFPLQIPSIQLYVMVLLGLLWSSDSMAKIPRAQRASVPVKEPSL